MEKRGEIVITEAPEKSEGRKNIFSVFKLENFVFYMIAGAIVEIASASINFWLPTYLVERLGFNQDVAGGIFSGMALLRSFMPFVALIILKWFRDNDIKMVKYSFGVATILFVGVLFVLNPYVNAILFLLALMAVGCPSALLWSVYIPAQGKSGMVSTVNGVLDFSGYAAAAAANMLFSFTVDKVGWNGLVVMWIGLMLIGVFGGLLIKIFGNLHIRKRG